MDFDFLPNGRKVIWVRNEDLELAVAEGGGHIAAVRLRGFQEDANPFWQPSWPSHEPDEVTEELVEAEYGGRPEGRLLASILGHSLALDLYGPPSAEETAAGGVTHGKAGVVRWKWETVGPATVLGACKDDFAQLRFSRRLQVKGNSVIIEEKTKNLCNWDRPIGWQQHVSFGAPFCEEGFWAASNCDVGSTHPQTFGPGAALIPNTRTAWPLAPQRNGVRRDYGKPIEGDATENDFTGYRVRKKDALGYFVAGNSNFGFAVAYLWPRQFFPWMGVWDERHARTLKPWSGRASVRAFEFGVSPFPETRREMLRRTPLFDLPTYLMLPAAGIHWVRYVLGVFPAAREAGTLKVSEETASLVEAGREMGRIAVPGSCASSKRVEMQTS